MLGGPWQARASWQWALRHGAQPPGGYTTIQVHASTPVCTERRWEARRQRIHMDQQLPASASLVQSSFLPFPLHMGVDSSHSPTCTWVSTPLTPPLHSIPTCRVTSDRDSLAAHTASPELCPRLAQQPHLHSAPDRDSLAAHTASPELCSRLAQQPHLHSAPSCAHLIAASPE